VLYSLVLSSLLLSPLVLFSLLSSSRSLMKVEGV
jgi:hypothetical protein